MRILGVDYGSKRIGLALGDTESRIASPWGVIANDGFDRVLAAIRETLTRESASAIVVGVPRPLQSAQTENAQVKEVRQFITALQGAGVSVFEVDEVLTSKLAARQMQERGEKGKRDDLAAANILQTWLDRTNGLSS